MADTNLGADSAQSNIITFPKRNKNRVRKSTGPRAEGILAMVQFDMRPSNVEHFRRDEITDVSTLELMAYGLDSIVRCLPPETIGQLTRRAMIDAALADCPRKRLLAAAYCAVFNK